MPAPLIAFALSALLALAPPGRTRALPGWEETGDQMRVRYASIAEDIGETARNRTEAALLVGVAVHESALVADVDAGTCVHAGGWSARCDGGRAVSIFQLQDASGERREAWRTSRRAAAREALRRILGSMSACRGNEPSTRLAMFASGSCKRGLVTARGLDASVRRAMGVMVPSEA